MNQHVKETVFLLLCCVVYVVIGEPEFLAISGASHRASESSLLKTHQIPNGYVCTFFRSSLLLWVCFLRTVYIITQWQNRPLQFETVLVALIKATVTI